MYIDREGDREREREREREMAANLPASRQHIPNCENSMKFCTEATKNRAV